MQMKIGFLLKKSWLGFGNHDLISQESNIIAKFEQKRLFCLISVYIRGTNAWKATTFAWISLGKDKEFIMFDDMHNSFKVTAGYD